MRFCLFGGVSVVGADGIQVHLGKKQQQLLAFLMLAANRTIPGDVLVDNLWEHQLPANPANSLQDLVKRLRIALGDESHSVVVTRNREYGLIANPDCLDLSLFRRLATAGLALQEAEPETSRLLLAHALEQAAGDLPDFKPGTRASDEIEDLYRLRLAAVNALQAFDSGPAEDSIMREGMETVPPQRVGLALNLSDLEELVLVDVVTQVRSFQGLIHRLSQGVLIASFPWVGAALRAAAHSRSACQLS